MKELVNLGILAKQLNTGAEVIISEIPVRKDYLNEHRCEFNDLLKKSMPESIHFVQHRNVTREMLYDKKHIKEHCIQNIVRNMKDKLRELIQRNTDSRRIEKNNEGRSAQIKGPEGKFKCPLRPELPPKRLELAGIPPNATLSKPHLKSSILITLEPLIGRFVGQIPALMAIRMNIKLLLKSL